MVCPKGITILATVLLCSLTAGKAQATDSAAAWGADLRLRIVDLNRIPTEAARTWPENRFLRVRSRLWGSYQITPQLSCSARLVNEWREYGHDKGTNNYQSLDEVVLDNLYIDLDNLFNHRLNLRIGRQELTYGTGKILRIGTPLDSSRTYYFNAVKASLHLDSLQADFLALQVAAEDELAIHSRDRPLLEGDENGGGLYIKNNRFPSVPQEYYYFYKHEQRAANLNLHTVGLRFMPKFSEQLTANLEMAKQAGHRQHETSAGGELLDLSLFYRLPPWRRLNSRLDLSYYYLSGDDPHSRTDEAWQPLWARYPQYMSYTMVRAQVPHFAAWSNISMPSTGLVVDITSRLKLATRLALVYAPEEGPGGGHKKGTLFVCRLAYTINKKWRANFHLEVMDPDDYYSVSHGHGHYSHFELRHRF